MKKLYISLFLFLFSVEVSFAEQNIKKIYNYYDREENDYSTVGMEYNLRAGAQMGSLRYSKYLAKADGVRLQEASLAYFYFGDKHFFGGFAGSSSDKPFNTLNLFNAAVIYGRSVYSKVLGSVEYTRPDGTKLTVDRKSNLYIGAAAASQPLFLDSYFFPVVSYFYAGENFHLRLGVPNNSITINPAKKHKIDIGLNLDANYRIAYEFSPTDADKLILFYGKEMDGYVLSRYNDRDNTLWYQREWIRFSYEHIFSSLIGVETTVGYMLSGNYYLGESFRSKSNMRLPSQYQFGVNLAVYF
jgi:hypothetical protein